MKNFVQATVQIFNLLIIVVLFADVVMADKVAPTSGYDSWLSAVNVPTAWKKGYTGNGVSIGIVDDSVDNQGDFSLTGQYNTGAVYNETGVFTAVNERSFGVAPASVDENSSAAVWGNYKSVSTGGVTGDAHGTCVAGCIAGYNTDNKVYGSAFNASLTGIRVDFNLQPCLQRNFPDKDQTDSCIATALKYNNSTIQLKNNSYGTRDGYNPLSETSITTILGSFNDARTNNTGLIFASGNQRDKCTMYTNGADSNKTIYNAHPYTISVTATGGNDGDNPDYAKYASFSNYGACTFVCAPGLSVRTSDRKDDTSTTYYINKKSIDPTTVYSLSYQGYKSGTVFPAYNGTSASAPIVTGILGLGIEAYQTANSGKTCDVRFLKHMLARTSTKVDMSATAEEVKWRTNSAGISFSHTYGFGQINAGELVTAIGNSKSYFGTECTDVTAQTLATTHWDLTGAGNKTISSEEKLCYKTVKSSYSSMSYATSTDFSPTYEVFVEPQSELSGTQGVQAVASNYQPLSAGDTNNWVQTFTTSFTGSDFTNAGITKQGLEEVVLTVDLSAVGVSFDSRDIQITLTHGNTLSYMAFTDSDSEGSDAYLSSMNWSYSSNAFWGEDPTGDWTVTISYSDTAMFNINNIWTSFYMGELVGLNTNIERYDASTESQSEWVLNGTEHNGVELKAEKTTVEHNENTTISAKATFDIASDSTIKQNGTLTLENNPNITVSGGGTLELNLGENQLDASKFGAITLETSALKLDTTTAQSLSNFNPMGSGSIILSGDGTSTSIYNLDGSDFSGLMSASSSIIVENAVANFNGSASLNDGSNSIKTIVRNGGQLYIQKDPDKANIYIEGNGVSESDGSHYGALRVAKCLNEDISIYLTGDATIGFDIECYMGGGRFDSSIQSAVADKDVTLSLRCNNESARGWFYYFRDGQCQISDGDGTLNLNIDNGRQIMQCILSYTGTTTIQKDATMSLWGAESNLNNSKAVTVDGTLDISKFEGTEVQVNNLTGKGTISGSGKRLVLNTDSNYDRTSPFVGYINLGTGDDGGTIVKTGSGILLLNGNEGHFISENFVVQEGQLNLKTCFTGNIDVQLGAELSPGNSIGDLTINGNLILETGANLIMEVDKDRADSLTITGDLTAADSTILLKLADGSSLQPNDPFSVYIEANNSDSLDWNSLVTSDYFSNLTYSKDTSGKWVLSGTYLASPSASVPEPSTWALLILGTAGLLWLRSERRDTRGEKA